MKSLRLADHNAVELRDDQPLMGGDLEIDSIDILQLVVDIERHFRIKLISGTFDKAVWRDINSLAAAVDERMQMRVKGTDASRVPEMDRGIPL